MNDLEPWSTGRLVQVEREIRDAQGHALARLRLGLRRLARSRPRMPGLDPKREENTQDDKYPLENDPAPSPATDPLAHTPPHRKAL